MTSRLAKITFLFITAAIAVLRADDFRYSEPFERSAPFDPIGTLSLENVSGEITVDTWERSGIRIVGEKSATSQEDLKRIEMTIDLSSSHAAIKVRLPKRSSGWGQNEMIRARVNFRITLPARASIESINTVNSSVNVTGIGGSTRVETVNGKVTARELKGATRLETVNGGIDADFPRLQPGQQYAFETVNGSVTVKLPANAGFKFHGSVVNGHIACDFEGNGKKKDLSGQVGNGESSVSAQAVNGSVRINKR